MNHGAKAALEKHLRGGGIPINPIPNEGTTLVELKTRDLADALERECIRAKINGLESLKITMALGDAIQLASLLRRAADGGLER